MTRLPVSDMAGARDEQDAISRLKFKFEDREELIGLEPLQGEIEIGGGILTPGTEAPPCETIGYVSSVFTRKHYGNIGMALIEAGS